MSRDDSRHLPEHTVLSADAVVELLFKRTPNPTKTGSEPCQRQWLNVCATTGRMLSPGERCADPACVHMDLKERRMREKERAELARLTPEGQPLPDENASVVEWWWSSTNNKGVSMCYFVV